MSEDPEDLNQEWVTNPPGNGGRSQLSRGFHLRRRADLGHFGVQQHALVLTPLGNFVVVAAAIYFVVVMPLNKLAERRARGVEPKSEAPSDEVALLTEIRDSLRARL